MKISNNFQSQYNQTFGTNIGFLKAAFELKKRVTPNEMANLQAHAQNLDKSDEFVKLVKDIVNDETSPKILVDLIERYAKILRD